LRYHDITFEEGGAEQKLDPFDIFDKYVATRSTLIREAS